MRLSTERVQSSIIVIQNFLLSSDIHTLSLYKTVTYFINKQSIRMAKIIHYLPNHHRPSPPLTLCMSWVHVCDSRPLTFHGSNHSKQSGISSVVSFRIRRTDERDKTHIKQAQKHGTQKKQQRMSLSHSVQFFCHEPLIKLHQ